MNDTSENYDILSTMIEERNLTANDVLLLFTKYNGLQIMTDSFIQFANDECLPDSY